MYRKFKSKYKVLLIFNFFIIGCLFSININASDVLDISGEAAILMCADSNLILFEKNSNMPLPMASTTKIMTSLLTCEKIAACGNLEFEVTNEMVNVEGTSMGLMPGDILKLDALVKGMLLASGNDAANAASIAVSGDTQKFIELMNEKALQIGMENTNFETPSGLDKGNHHSTAKDMAILGSYAMENKLFSEIAKQKNIKVEFINPCKTVNYKNHNKLLRLYNGCIGIKTGFTKKSGRCLVSCAERNGIRLVCVTLHAHNDWDDHIKLFDYGFENTVLRYFNDKDFKFSVPVKGAENADKLNVKGNSSFSRSFKKDENVKVTRRLEMPEVLSAPIEEGEMVGKIFYYIGNKKIGQNDVVADVSIRSKARPIKKIFKKIGKFFNKVFR